MSFGRRTDRDRGELFRDLPTDRSINDGYVGGQGTPQEQREFERSWSNRQEVARRRATAAKEAALERAVAQRARDAAREAEKRAKEEAARERAVLRSQEAAARLEAKDRTAAEVAVLSFGLRAARFGSLGLLATAAYDRRSRRRLERKWDGD